MHGEHTEIALVYNRVGLEFGRYVRECIMQPHRIAILHIGREEAAVKPFAVQQAPFGQAEDGVCRGVMGCHAVRNHLDPPVFDRARDIDGDICTVVVQNMQRAAFGILRGAVVAGEFVRTAAVIAETTQVSAVIDGERMEYVVVVDIFTLYQQYRIAEIHSQNVSHGRLPVQRLDPGGVFLGKRWRFILHVFAVRRARGQSQQQHRNIQILHGNIVTV